MKLRYGYTFYDFPLHVEHRVSVRRNYRSERASVHHRSKKAAQNAARDRATDLAVWCVAAPHVTKLGLTRNAPDFLRPDWTPEAAA